MTLAAFQIEFGGLVMGDGTDYDLVTLDGLEGLPAMVQTDQKRPRAHGQFLGGMFASGRQVTAVLEVTAATDAAFRADLDALSNATTPLPFTETPFTYSLPGMTGARMVGARALDRAIIVDVDYVHRVAHAACRWWATDPLVYSDPAQTLWTSVPLDDGGVAWPGVWPLYWGVSSSSGLITAINAGGIAAPVVIVLTGPVDNPTVTNLTEGKALAFSLHLGPTDTLTIDPAHFSVLLNGIVNKRGSMTPGSRWWDLQPGANVIAYHAASALSGSTATLSWRSAWM